MSVHVSFNRNCDRCEKPFDMRTIKYDEGLPKIEPKPLVLTDDGKQVFSYSDLCPTCDTVVRKLVKRLLLDEEKEKKTDAGPSAKAVEELVGPVGKEETKEPEATPASGAEDHPF